MRINQPCKSAGTPKAWPKLAGTVLFKCALPDSELVLLQTSEVLQWIA